MQISEEHQQMLFQSTGMKPLPTPMAMNCLWNILDEGNSQELVLYGDQNKISEVFGAYIDNNGEGWASNTYNDFEQTLKSIVADALKLNPQDLDSGNDLDVLKTDLIAVSEISNHIQERFGVAMSVSEIYQQGHFGALLDRLLHIVRPESDGERIRSVEESKIAGHNIKQPASGESVGSEVDKVLDALKRGHIDVEEALEMI